MPNRAPQRQRDRLTSEPPGGRDSALLTARITLAWRPIGRQGGRVVLSASGRAAPACPPSSDILLVALEQFDRDVLRSTYEADANARPNGCWLLGEFDTLG